MHKITSSVLLLAIAAASMLPAFPILGVLQNHFPELPEYYDINNIASYIVKAVFILFCGMISMCIYSDIACPLAIKGYVYVFSRM